MESKLTAPQIDTMPTAALPVRCKEIPCGFEIRVAVEG